MKQAPVRITGYFDFMCPWSYLGRARLKHALQKTNIPAHLEWIPFELYAHDQHHRVKKETIIGHARLTEVYTHLHPLGLNENILIHPPKYKASSKRALIGFLFAQKEGKGEKYLDAIYTHVFEHSMDISSFAVLRRIAISLRMDPQSFLTFIHDEKNARHVEELTRLAKLNGVRGVPTYLINHLPVTGALHVSELEHILRMADSHTTPAYLLPEKKLKRFSRKKKNKTQKKSKKSMPPQIKKARLRTSPSQKKKKGSRSLKRSK